MLSRRKISVLRRTARLFMEKAFRISVISDLDCSGGKVTDAIPAASSSLSMESEGRLHLDSLGSRVSPVFGMVDGSGPSSVGHLPSSGQPSPRLLVRRFRLGVERSSTGCNRFRPLVSGRGSSIYQREGAPCGGVRPLVVPTLSVQLHGGNVCGQFHSSGLSPQIRGHSFSSPQLYCSEDPPLGRVDHLDSVSPVHPGQEQCSSGLLVSPKPSPRVRVDAEVGGFSGAEQQVAGDDRSFCHLPH